jgi:hypothetical protein
MRRFFVSTVIGVVVGLLVGLFAGWQIIPVEYQDSPIRALSEPYRDEYTRMVAGGYLADGDVIGAVERLRVLGMQNIPQYVQEVAESYISNSRDLKDIRYLVALSEGLGRLTPLMENFRQLSRPPLTTPIPPALTTEEASDA